MSFAEKYIRMLKAGLPLSVITQTLCVDVQCKDDDDRMKVVVNWLKKMEEGCMDVEQPFSVLQDLMRTKYNRMIERGIKGDKLEYVKYFDNIIMKEQSKRIDEFGIPPEVEGVGLLIDDRVVKDDHGEEQISEAQRRAIEFKKETIAIRTVLVKSDVEKSTDEVDNAPLTSLETTTKEDDKFQFHSHLLPKFPQPSICREQMFELLNLSGLSHKCIFREHLPGRMYSFLNVLSKTECEQLQRQLEFSDQEQKVQLEYIKIAQSKNQSIIRTNIRRNFIDFDVAKLVWRTVKEFLPETLEDGRKIAGIRTKMNYYRYGTGEYFKTHIDGGFRFTTTGETSVYTFVIYLNDNFEGGTTRFCPLPEWNKEPREVIPTQGGMLIFNQSDMKHCGVTINQGFKHILQGMVMYGPLRHNELGKPFGKPPQLFVVTSCDC